MISVLRFNLKCTLMPFRKALICLKTAHSFRSFCGISKIIPFEMANDEEVIVYIPFSSVQSLTCVWLFATPWSAAPQASLSITNSWRLPKLMSTEPVMPSNHLILCHPLLLLPSIFPSIRVFSNDSALCMKWPKYLNFSFNISPSMSTQDWSPCSPKDSQASSPIPQFKSVSSSTLSFLYNPNLTSIYGYWKNHSLN